MGAGSLQRFDASVQGYDLFAVFDFLEQRGLEIEESDAEYHPGPVQGPDLPGCGLERLGARSGRHEHVDGEIAADDLAHEAAQRQDRNAERLAVGFRFRGARYEDQCGEKCDCGMFHLSRYRLEMGCRTLQLQGKGNKIMRE